MNKTYNVVGIFLLILIGLLIIYFDQSGIDWNSQNILSFVVAAATVAYTWINFGSLLESHATRKQKTTPFIVAFLEFSEINETQIILRIKNIGEGIAKNITFNIIKDYPWVEGYPLSKRGALKYGISSFTPQYELNYILVVNSIEVNFEDADSYIELSIKYHNSSGKVFNENFNLHFNEITMQGFTKPPYTYKRAHIFQLDSIKKCLETIAKK